MGLPGGKFEYRLWDVRWRWRERCDFVRERYMDCGRDRGSGGSPMSAAMI